MCVKHFSINITKLLYDLIPTSNEWELFLVHLFANSPFVKLFKIFGNLVKESWYILLISFILHWVVIIRTSFISLLVTCIFFLQKELTEFIIHFLLSLFSHWFAKVFIIFFILNLCWLYVLRMSYLISLLDFHSLCYIHMNRTFSFNYFQLLSLSNFPLWLMLLLTSLMRYHSLLLRSWKYFFILCYMCFIILLFRGKSLFKWNWFWCVIWGRHWYLSLFIGIPNCLCSFYLEISHMWFGKTDTIPRHRSPQFTNNSCTSTIPAIIG